MNNFLFFWVWGFFLGFALACWGTSEFLKRALLDDCARHRLNGPTCTSMAKLR